MNEYIDHTILKPDATRQDIVKLCSEAMEYKFASVCVAPTWVLDCENILKGDVTIATVIGFPHGNICMDNKDEQLFRTSHMGATEFDVVIDIGAVKSGLWKRVENEIHGLREDLESVKVNRNLIIKYIVEIGYLTDDELFKISDMLIKHKIDFIKTCTGYGPRGVTVEDIVKIKKHVGDAIKIKASGGIKTADFAKQLIEAGANRIGCSSSVSIMNEINNTR